MRNDFPVSQPSAISPLGCGYLLKYFVFFVLVWTLLIGLSLVWTSGKTRNNLKSLALVQARALSSKDVVYRRWGGSFGGIYVNLNSGVQPNPLLTTHPQRDVVTDSGTRLTMINHEYMSQMVYDLEDQSQGIKTALISLNPLNPLNRPSTFETAALQQLREGRKDVSLIEQNETGRFLRLITPLRTEKNCLQCHRNNGFVLDEVCCGLSVTVPMAPYEQQAATELFNSAIAHSLIWLFGLLAITVGFKQFHRSEQARRKTEDELIWAKIKAEDASRAKGDFLANMSHEVRTPMNSIIGMTELVLDSPLSRYQQDCLETVKYSADSLLELINDILDFSKLEAGMLEYEQVPFNLPLLVEEAMRSLAVPAQKKGLEIAFWVAETVPVEMTGDPQRLKQILLNLLSNAVKFTERGRVVLGVSMDADVLASARVSFAVEDTGIGIPEDFQDKLFSSYAQAEASTSRKFGGSGLGLAISKALAEGMGGTIRLQSQVGEGTTFTVVLPCPEAEKTVPAPEPVGAGKRILVVDDQETSREILARNLRRLGAEVGTIDSGDSAVQMLHEARFRQVPYDGAIIDYHMPGLDGFSTVEILREHIDPQLPVIMMFTAKELGQAIDRCNEYKIDDYLVKPVSLGQLQQSLSVLFNPRIKTTEREPDEKRESVQLSSGTRQFHLLLAEDNPFNQKLTTALADKKNWKLTIVSDGQAAVDAVSQNHFDLVLMDVQMPEIDGLAATRKIRQLSGERKHPLPIIGMTAYALSGDRERCLAAGMDDYLSKPIKPELFYTVVERHLARSAASDREEAFASSLNQVFDQNLEKNRSLMVDMAKDFLADYPELLKKLHSSVEHEEWRDMERLAHNLKSVVGFFNAEKAYALARDLEFAARDKDLSRIAPVFQALEEELQKVQTKLLEI